MTHSGAGTFYSSIGSSFGSALATEPRCKVIPRQFSDIGHVEMTELFREGTQQMLRRTQSG